jgi:hypothetical protein
MRCVYYDIVRWSRVSTKDCEKYPVDNVVADDVEYPLCQKHLDLIVGVYREWFDGSSTYRHEMAARSFFARHPKYDP